MANTTGSTPATLLHREVWNRGDLALIDNLVTANYHHSDPLTPAPLTGPDALKTHIGLYRRAIPDLEKTVTQTVADDDTIALTYTASGTVQPSHPTLSVDHEFTISGAYIATITDDRISHGYDHWNLLEFLASIQQLSDQRTTNHTP